MRYYCDIHGEISAADAARDGKCPRNISRVPLCDLCGKEVVDHDGVLHQRHVDCGGLVQYPYIPCGQQLTTRA